MSIYSRLQYLKYKFKAKSRHGTHSPYVYSFIEQVLRDYTNFSYPDKFSKFFGASNIIYIQRAYPKQWQNLLALESQRMSGDTVIILQDIYKSPLHTQSWQRAKELPQVRMSIDIYYYGILLFKNEFREKQDFIVKD